MSIGIVGAGNMGHANISITLDRYGHLMPGSEDEAAALLDAFLVRANTKARLEAVGASGNRSPSSGPETLR